MRSSLKTKTPLTTRKPLQRRTRLRAVSKKRQDRRRKVALERVAAVAREAGDAFARLGTAGHVAVTTLRRAAEALAPKAVEFVSIALMEQLHQLPCWFCKTPGPVTAHHWPPVSIVGVRNDCLTVPACGSGTTGCHGAAQRREIGEAMQCRGVGETLAVYVKLGLVSWPAVELALRSIPRHDVEATIRQALIAALAIPGEGWR